MIHSTAIIDKSAVIGQNVEIGPYSVIGPDTVIGDGTVISSHATIECANIGKNCKIFPHASIGLAPQDLKYAGEKTKLFVGDGTTVREFVTLNRGTSASGQTVIGKNCLFMACSHVAHDCIVGDNVIVANCAAIAGHVEIGDGVVIGGFAGMLTSASVADANTNISDGVLQGILDSVIKSNGNLASLLQATLSA